MRDLSILSRLLYKVRHHMSLEVIDIDHRDPQSLTHPLGEIDPDQE